MEEEEIQSPVVEETPAAEPVVEQKPDTVTMSKSELADFLKENVRGAIDSYRKEQEEAAKPAPTPTYDPVVESTNAVRSGIRMTSEALNLYPDLPKKYQDQIQDELEKIPADQIAAFRKGELHLVIARNIAMRAIDDEEYAHPKSKGKTTPTQRIEPISAAGAGGGPSLSRGGVPKEFADEADELAALLGLPKPDDKKLLQMYKTPANSGS